MVCVKDMPTVRFIGMKGEYLGEGMTAIHTRCYPFSNAWHFGVLGAISLRTNGLYLGSSSSCGLKEGSKEFCLQKFRFIASQAWGKEGPVSWLPRQAPAVA